MTAPKHAQSSKWIHRSNNDCTHISLTLNFFLLHFTQFYDKIESEKITIWNRTNRECTFLRSRAKMAVSRKRSDRSRFSSIHGSLYHYIPKGVINVLSNARSFHILWILQVFTAYSTATNLPLRRDERKTNYELRAKVHTKKSAGNSICAYWLVKWDTWLITRYLRGRNECKEFWEVRTNLNMFTNIDRKKKNRLYTFPGILERSSEYLVKFLTSHEMP